MESRRRVRWALAREEDHLAGNQTQNQSQSQSQNQPKSTTIVKYEKSSCLFCNEWFDAQTFTEHLIHCGQVLEECPNSCQVFIPRIRMRSHLKECPRSKNLHNQRLSVSMDRLDQQSDHRLQVLEQDISTIRSVLNEEIRQRLHLITDVGNIRKQNQVVEDWTRGTDDTLGGLRRQLEEEASQRAYAAEQNQIDFQYCCNITQSLKDQVEIKLDEAQKLVNQLSIDVTFHQNQLNDNILKLEELIFENERLNRDKFFRIEEFLQQINEDIKTKLGTSDYATNKQATLDYEVKNVKNIVCETEERCDKLQTVVQDLDRSLHQTMQNLSDLENQMAMQQRIASVQNIRGHLIFRIKDYSKKLDEAKQYDTILHSAMFSNKAFGYALRLDIYLNGKGTWKGRNLIACLNVLSGEYDPLLAWPCRLQAEVVIRDQCSNLLEAQDYVKTIFVRKKSDDFIQSNQYFHIPHKVITSRNYLRNDSMFIEVRIMK
ncbi:TNF receptor-associated factor 3 [Drosophila guanche]|uniref:Blast:TNF receptor-associated factor 3 n=1 Tax=Drosophila guanche TaxID=7266 RepID=A0A3B0K3I4_DROGU|nr:TNF receptor-associated factor 3 [Drosophila guanche]XP_034138794.1 TNF receptor-associated factor 3 [Drosophila guanche]SPP88764.1 blast:TNF receptor-associated factor 3 [Drosophila guanche]